MGSVGDSARVRASAEPCGERRQCGKWGRGGGAAGALRGASLTPSAARGCGSGRCCTSGLGEAAELRRWWRRFIQLVSFLVSVQDGLWEEHQHGQSCRWADPNCAERPCRVCVTPGFGCGDHPAGTAADKRLQGHLRPLPRGSGWAASRIGVRVEPFSPQLGSGGSRSRRSLLLGAQGAQPAELPAAGTRMQTQRQSWSSAAWHPQRAAERSRRSL